MYTGTENVPVAVVGIVTQHRYREQPSNHVKKAAQQTRILVNSGERTAVRITRHRFDDYRSYPFTHFIAFHKPKPWVYNQ